MGYHANVAQNIGFVQVVHLYLRDMHFSRRPSDLSLGINDVDGQILNYSQAPYQFSQPP